MPTAIYIETYFDGFIEKEKANAEAINGLCLNIIEVSDPLLATCIHDERNNKSFTTRKLSLRKNFLDLRITILEDNYFDRIANVLLNACTRPFLLNDYRLMVSRIMCSKESENYWANQITYNEIYEKASKEDTKIFFNIHTPLAFKSGDNFIYLPYPDLFFKSLHNRWNTFSEIKFDNSLLEMIKENVFIDDYDIKTESLLSTTIKLKGCIGKVSYRALKKVDTNFIHYINTLSDFAYFSGVGIKTILGMGQVSRLYREKHLHKM